MISRIVYILFLTSQCITTTIQSEYSYSYTQLPNLYESKPSAQPTVQETLLNPSLEITATESSNKKKEYVKTESFNDMLLMILILLLGFIIILCFYDSYKKYVNENNITHEHSMEVLIE